MYKKTGWGFAITALIVAGALYSIYEIPFKLGIDLQGGTELTYQLDVGDVVANRQDLAETVKDIIASRLDRYGLKEISIATLGADRIVVQIPGVSDAELIKQQIEETGQLDFMLRAPDRGARITQLWEEVNKYNREYARWSDQVAANPDDKSLLAQRPRKGPEWRKLEEEHLAYEKALAQYEARRLEAGGQPPADLQRPEPPEWVIYPRGEWKEQPGGGRSLDEDLSNNRVLHFEDEYKVSGGLLQSAQPVTDERDGSPAIGFTFNGQGATLFAELTGKNVKRQLTIVLDQKIIQEATIDEQIGASGRISGDFGYDEVLSVCNLLQGGSLPSKPLLIAESQIGPRVSRQAITNGAAAVASGMLVVMVFMLVYYMLGGVVANVALILNIVLILAYVAVFRQTLTVPGIAGIILTIGMAVDANILIFERVREELRKGKALIAALGTGYRRAFWVIFDSNLTTLITGIILFQFGTGPVKGFAVTLIAGILASFFTAVFVTRLILSLMINLGWLKSKFPMMNLIGVPKIPFQRYRRGFGILSVLLILGSWTLVVARGKENYGVDFNGGSKLTINTARPIRRQQLEQWVIDLKKSSPELDALFDDFSVQTVGDENGKGAATSFSLVVRSVVPDIEELPSDGDAAASSGPGESAESAAEGAEDASQPAKELTVAERNRREETIESQLRDQVRREVEKILREQDLLLPSPFPGTAVTGDSIGTWVPAAGKDGEQVPDQLGLQFDVNLLDFEWEDPSRPHEDVLEELLDHHLEQAFQDAVDPDATEPTAFKGLGVASVSVVSSRTLNVDSGAGRDLTTFRVQTTGYVEPPEEVAEFSRVPTHQEVERSIRDFLRLESPVLTGVADPFQLSEPFSEVVTIGQRVANNLQQQAIVAFFIAVVAIIFYLSLRFEFAFGLAAITALVHDVMISIGIVALTDFLFGRTFSLKINLPEVAALLTIVGYSVNDTIVVFDRIRENLRSAKKTDSFVDLVNVSINQTLARTVWTSTTTLVVILTLLIFGGEAVRGFAFTFAVGLVAGTYSSIFVASPAAIFFRRRAAERRERIKAEAARA